MTEPWLMRVEGALAAHFKQENGPSRPGIEWTIGLKHGEATYTALVRAYLASDATAATRADRDYQARTVMQYLNDLIAKGWDPGQTRAHVITIGNRLADLPGAAQAAAKKPWWRLW